MSSFWGEGQSLRSYTVVAINPKNPEEIVAGILQAALEPNVRHLEESLLIDADFNIVRSKSFPALLSVIYSHLVDAAAGQRKYVLCKFKECGNYFLQKDPRREYCPHPDNPKCESLCSLMDRKRTWQVKSKKNL